MPFLDEIRVRLEGAGVGTLGVNIFQTSKNPVPAGDGPYLSLIETGGSGASETHDDTATENPTAQISCRASTAVSARNMLKAAYDALGGANGLHNVTISGVQYLKVKARQNPTDIGLDANGRAFYAFNIEAEKQPS